ncbi:MAG TPA: hypothetical protein PLR02_05755 [Rhodocyclaceae bacterium]|nr:hypothetical protein [Rhodocyclaceae bacterium]
MSKWLIYGVGLTGLALLAPVAWMFFDEAPAPPTESGYPWQIDLPAPGQSRVFGLRPGHSSVAEASALFGPDVDIAIVAPPGHPASLEAYFESVQVGRIMGKLVLTVDADDATLAAMRERAAKVEYMESTTRKITLSRDDLADARGRAIRAITFIPSANLDEDIVLQRFGPPAMRVRVSDEREHFLYPDKGLDLALDSRTKEVLQYVAPQDFERLRQPLLQHVGTAPPAHPEPADPPAPRSAD